MFVICFQAHLEEVVEVVEDTAEDEEAVAVGEMTKAVVVIGIAPRKSMPHWNNWL